MRNEHGKAVFLIRTVGGPTDGQTRMVPEDVLPWPLPDRLPLRGGVYVKRTESQMPAGVDDNEHVARGAEYEWVEG